jgi:hypothetical protein
MVPEAVWRCGKETTTELWSEVLGRRVLRARNAK